MSTSNTHSCIKTVTAAALAAVTLAAAQPAFAQARVDRTEDRVDRRESAADRSVNNGAADRAEDRVDFREGRVDRNTGAARPAAYTAPAYRRPVAAAPNRVVVYPTVVAPRTRYYNNVYVYRPYGPAYFGYGYYYNDNEAAAFLAFTAITVKLIDELSEAQARKHEQAQVEAATAAVGESITWEDGSASGSVTVVRQGTSTSGKQCREFQQTVEIGGKSESAYGTACLQEDGSWKIVS
jgi:surface antigen